VLTCTREDWGAARPSSAPAIAPTRLAPPAHAQSTDGRRRLV